MPSRKRRGRRRPNPPDVGSIVGGESPYYTARNSRGAGTGKMFYIKLGEMKFEAWDRVTLYELVDQAVNPSEDGWMAVQGRETVHPDPAPPRAASAR